MMKNHGGINMSKFEVIYSKIIDANDFFDAIEKAEKEDAKLLTVSSLDDEDVLD